jgi:hypothetical protein
MKTTTPLPVACVASGRRVNASGDETQLSACSHRGAAERARSDRDRATHAAHSRNMPYRNVSMASHSVTQAKLMWPFIAGFGVVGAAVTCATLGVTKEDIKKSSFANPGGQHH